MNAENTECHLKIFEADGAFPARLDFLEVSSFAIGPVVESQKREDAGAQKGREVAKYYVFSNVCFVAPESHLGK